jgi:hypothetical protein
MPVEDDLETSVASPLNDAIHQFQSSKPFEVRVEMVVDVLWLCPWPQHIVAIRQAYGVETQIGNLVEKGFPVTAVQAVGSQGIRFEAKPAYARDLDSPASEIVQATTTSVQIVWRIRVNTRRGRG